MVNGAAIQNENRKEVLSQLIAVSDVSKCSAELLDTGENDNQSHDTTMLSSTSCDKPKKRRL